MLSTCVQPELRIPGQGSQSVGMLGAPDGAFPDVSQTFAEASDVLGLDLWELVQEAPKAELNLAHATQAAMLAAGVAVWRRRREQGGARPALMAEHSLGEYTALVCAEALDFPGLPVFDPDSLSKVLEETKRC